VISSFAGVWHERRRQARKAMGAQMAEPHLLSARRN
jgi:hypothetical protein